MAFTKGGRGEDFFAEIAFGQGLVGFARLDGAKETEIVDEVDVAFGAGEGGVVLTQTLFPEDVTCFGVEAVGDAGVGDDKELAAFNNGRGHVADAFIGPPDDVGIGDIAAAVGLDGEEMVLRKATGHVEQACLLTEDEGCDELLGRAVNDPKELTGAGIVAGDAFATGEDHLGAACDVADERDAVTAGIVGPGDAPELFTVSFGKGDDVTIAVVVAVDDDSVFKDDGAGAEAVLAGEKAGADLPKLFSTKVVRGDDDGAFGDFSFGDGASVGSACDIGFAVVEEGGEDALSVAGGGAGSLAVELVDALDGSFNHGGLPKGLARGAVDADEDAVLGLLNGCDDEEAVFADDGGSMTAARELDLPGDIAFSRDGEASVA